MPYGIFTPQSGSVSGIYIRLPAPFMQTAAGAWDLTTYAQNLDLVEKAITDKLEGQTHYLGAAARISITRGAYPKGTEFAHPLHYVDMTQPGTRAKRVKEVRWMYKYLEHDPMTAQADDGAGEALYLNGEQGWIDNGAGWLLSGFIEDAQGDLRPQRGEELAQCIGCHSGFRQTTGENFVSGLSSTVDSSWAMVRKLPGEAGWKEMDYLGYLPPGAEALIAAEVGQSSRPEPKNRKAQIGEFGLFLETVVGASLYGEMPAHLEVFLAQEITQASGYAQDWPALNLAEPIAYEASVKARSALLKTYVARGDYLTGEGRVKGDLLYPPMQASLAGAARYRQVVVTQSYDLGKDVFAQTPVSFKHYRPRALAEKKPDGQVYSWGELILERPVNQDPASEAYHAGNAPTLIEAAKPYPAGVYYPDYLPLVD
jgi:hypothetical protein